MEGEKLLFQATIVGKPEPDIIWSKNDKPVVTNKRITPSKKNNCYELEILSCETIDSGQYSIKASNAAGESQTQAVARILGSSPLHAWGTYFSSGVFNATFGN